MLKELQHRGAHPLLAILLRYLDCSISVKVFLYNFYASVKKLSASQHTGDQTFTMSRYFRLTPSLALAMCLGRQAYAAYAAYAAFAACA